MILFREFGSMREEIARSSFNNLPTFKPCDTHSLLPSLIKFGVANLSTRCGVPMVPRVLQFCTIQLEIYENARERNQPRKPTIFV